MSLAESYSDAYESGWTAARLSVFVEQTRRILVLLEAGADLAARDQLNTLLESHDASPMPAVRDRSRVIPTTVSASGHGDG